MESPEIVQQGPDYVAIFEHIQFRYSKLKEHTEGYSAILRVSVQDYPGIGTGELFDGRYQLFGPSAKRDVARALGERIREEDWAAYLTVAARSVISHIEEGMPVVDLGEGELAEPNPPMLSPLLRQNEHTVLFGLGGTGKSTIALAAAACLDQGIAYIGDTAEQAKVLVLDWEDEEDNVRWRLDQLREGWGMSQRPNILWKRCDVSLNSMTDALTRQVTAQRIQYLIIDSAAIACGLEPETADAANTFFRVLRGLGRVGIIGSLTLAHQPKERERSNYPFGSIFWWNNPRAVWKAEKSQDEGASNLHVGLFHKKANNGPLSRPMAFNIEYSKDSIRLTSEQVSKVSELREHIHANEQIEQTVSEWMIARKVGPTRAELRTLLMHLKKGTFDAAVSRLLHAGRITERNGRLSRIQADDGSLSL